MNVLIACECSGVVREAFRARGHNAWSCDIKPAEDKSPHHFQTEIEDLLNGGRSGDSNHQWDLMIAHPPCTYLAVSGIHWNHKRPERWAKTDAALAFFEFLLNDTGIPKIAIENPVGVASTHIRKPDQYIQPWQFGHGETKKTGLWLKNLPKLQPTNIVPGRENRIHRMPPSPQRSTHRSRTYPGIAEAMATQWNT